SGNAGFTTTYLGGPITSPSGLWQFTLSASAGHESWGALYVAARSDVEYLGTYPISTPYDDSPSKKSLSATGYHDQVGSQWVKLVDGEIHDAQSFRDGELYDLSSGNLSWQWNGLTTIDFTSVTNVNDFSTWSWTAHYYASGPSLAPEIE